MASVKYGLVITDIKGKVGGHVLKGGISGGVLQTNVDAIRDSAKLIKADAGRVINVLPITATIAGAWRGLSDAERASWTTGAVNFPAYNKFGVAYTPSGYQVFMTLNFQIYQMTGAFLTECPVPITVPDLADFTVGFTPPTGLNIIYSTSIDTLVNARVEATQPMAAGRAPKSSFFKVIGEYDNADASPIAIYTAYTNVYGAIPANANIWFRITNVALGTGQKGVPMVILLQT